MKCSIGMPERTDEHPCGTLHVTGCVLVVEHKIASQNTCSYVMDPCCQAHRLCTLTNDKGVLAPAQKQKQQQQQMLGTPRRSRRWLQNAAART